MFLTRDRTAFAFGIAIAMLAGACGGDGGTGPGPRADPAATAAKLEALDNAFDTPAFQSFELAAGYSPAASAASSSDLRAALRAVQAGPGTRPAIPVLRHRLDQRRDAGVANAFPPEILGTTFEWNPTSGTYEATTRTGAPADGVRFILYALGSGGLPTTPLQEIGYADFKDESTASTVRVHIIVVAGGTTYVDYAIAIDATTFNFSMVGFVTDGTHRLDFSLTFSGTDTVFSEEIRFDINAENAHVSLAAETEILSETSLRSTIDYRIQFGPDVVTLTGTTNLNGSAVSGALTFKMNGREIATFTFDGAGGQWSGPGGSAISQDDLQALTMILSGVGNLFLRLEALLLL